jgi:hypothetical protein
VMSSSKSVILNHSCPVLLPQTEKFRCVPNDN